MTLVNVSVIAGGLCAAYLFGSLPTAYLIGQWVRGLDIRQHGSGNVGASNVFRVVGKKWGVIVLVIDITKGVLAATVVGGFCALHLHMFHPLLTKLLMGLAAVCGHIWTVWLRFQGGKGVATTCGVALAVTPVVTLLSLGIWLLTVIMTRFISVASIAAALFFPLFVVFIHKEDAIFVPMLTGSILLALLIVYMHRSNIGRLRAGTEHRVLSDS